jgi:nicotinate-nucleotide pyrophosphorylase (carboxylating)
LVFAITVPDVDLRPRVDDGDQVGRGDRLLTVAGPGRGLLTAERTALNLLCHLSGIATLTSRWVRAIADSKAQIRDTRKTTPLLRSLEKYAVRCGGGANHRLGLSDAALVKDNHVAAAGGVVTAYRQVRERFPDLPVQVEVTSPEQAAEAVAAGADELLLDNMSIRETRRAVEVVAGRARLEASGGLTLERAAEVAATGVDYLAVGALTHSAPALDIAMDLRPGSS